MKYTSFILFLLFVSCDMGRELLKTESSNSIAINDGFVYENDTVKVTYNFWQENGVMGMDIYNKLNIPIFIDWKVSAFIDNGNNFQYWYDVQNATAINTNVNYYGLKTITGNPVSMGKGMTNIITTKPDRVTSIPPHSDIMRTMYRLIPKDTKFTIGVYNADNSPVKFRNYLALSTDESFTHKFYIDNQFYVSIIEVLDENKFEELKKMPDGTYKNVSPYQSPNCFYTNKYQISTP